MFHIYQRGCRIYLFKRRPRGPLRASHSFGTMRRLIEAPSERIVREPLSVIG
jgi:hypothetical protein